MRGVFKLNSRLVAASIGALSLCFLGASSAKATLIESWEGGLDGWQIPSPFGSQTANFVAIPLSTTGVTNGTVSMGVGPTSGNTASGPNYSQLAIGPSSVTLTPLLGHASAIDLDIFAPSGSFGGFLQFDMDLNNNDLGFASLDGFSYPSTTLGAETTLVFPITPAQAATLAASSNPTTIILQVGGGFTAGNETFYMDNLRTSDLPEPASLTLLGGGIMALTMRRRRA